MTRKRFRIGWMGLWIVLLALAGGGQAGSYLHLLTVHHAVCAQHGDLADVTAPGSAALAARDSRDQARPEFLAPQAVESGDHHCFATAGRRESVVLPAADTVRPDLAIGVILPRPVDDDSPRGARFILSFAPKHSPPTA